MTAAHRLVAGLVMAALGLVIGGCSSSQRTAQNFCTHYRADKAHYLQKYGAEQRAISGASQGNSLFELLGAAGMGVQMLGSLDEMFTDLANVAPPTIETQVAQVRDSIKKQEDLLSGENPLSGGSVLQSMLGSLTTGLESSDSWDRVAAYIQSTCHST